MRSLNAIISARYYVGLYTLTIEVIIDTINQEIEVAKNELIVLRDGKVILEEKIETEISEMETRLFSMHAEGTINTLTVHYKSPREHSTLMDTVEITVVQIDE